MNTHTTQTRLARFLFVVLFVFTLFCAQPAYAQDGQPPVPTSQPPDRPPYPEVPHEGEATQGGIRQSGTGEWLDIGSASNAIQPEQAAPSSPDYYGYTYDTATYSWVDVAGSGTRASLTTNGAEITSAISIPFTFKFYENSYTRLFISKYGYLTFTDNGYVDSQSRLPSQYSPNNVVAPYWTPLWINSSGSTGHVYYKSYGTTPGSRSFAIQWYQMKGTNYEGDEIGGDDLYDFEVILHENGNIVFQYRQMAYNGESWWCGYAGIEDMRGSDGLSSFPNCGKITSKTAVRYTRPTSLARVLLFPNQYGAFATPGGQANIAIPLKNIGDLGADVFDLQYNCPANYLVQFRNATSLATLEDTNASGYPDTGPVEQGASITVLATITMPSPGNIGDSAGCNFWAIPGLDFDQWRYAKLSVAYPAPFTQVYRDDANVTMRFTTVKPDAQPEYTASSTNVTGEYTAVAEAPNGNIVYAWTQYRCAGTNCSKYYGELYYTIRKPTGEAVKSATRLKDLSTLASLYGYDRTPAIAVAPDGTIGIAFVRYLTRTDYRRTMNTMLATINTNGTVLGTYQVTGNSTFTTDHHWLYEPDIAATADNRFGLAWSDYYYSSSSGSRENIYAAFYSSNGSVVKAPAARTNDTSSSNDSYYSASLAAIANNRVVLAFRSSGDDDIMYQVINSSGSTAKSTTNLTNDGTSYYEYYPDVARLSNGSLLFSFVRSGSPSFAILDSSYNLVSINSLNYIGLYPAGLSATTDNAGHGILTWIDDDVMKNQAIYYAAVGSSGQILTNSMIMKQTTGSYATSWLGKNNTSFTIAPASTNTDLYINGLAQVVTAPGRSTNSKLPFGNLGLAPTSTITITADKSDELLFGSIPDASCSGNTCTWTLTDANLGYLGSGVVNLPITMPSVTVGTTYQVTVHISSPETDDIAANNELVIEFIAGTPTYLPLITRN